MKLTSKLRQHDVVGLNIGATVTNYQVIPPHEKAFISRSYCPADCIAEVRFSSCDVGVNGWCVVLFFSVCLLSLHF